MKVVHLCTMIGESSAYYRLQNALKNKNIESVAIVAECNQKLNNVKIYRHSAILRKKTRFLEPFIRKYIEVKYNKRKREPFSLSLIGGNVFREQWIRDADIIHLHWICNFLSPRVIKKLSKLGKPLVWTCHDSWPFTGGCHVRYNCDKYRTQCKKCPVLDSNTDYDLSTFIFNRKNKYLSKLPITFIAPSNWMKKNLETSMMFRGNRCVVIPNTLDLNIFNDKDIDDVAKKLNYQKDFSKIHLLFGAVVLKIPYKGLVFFTEALRRLWEEHNDVAKKTVIHFIGADKCEDEILKYYECKRWGYIVEQEKMACIYNMADILVFPTLEDNLPGMVMESLACATPVVAFDTGGVSDMVVHKENGYIAQHGDSSDLLNGILWVIDNNKENVLGKNGREKIKKEFNPELIAQKHIDLYNILLEGKNV